jgi:uncharacterized protein
MSDSGSHPGDAQFVGTNVFLRFLTNDVPEQTAAVSSLLTAAAAGDLRLTTNAMVIAEIVWTLESFYRLQRADVAAKVTAILNTLGLQVAEASLLLEAVADYVDFNVDFIAAYNGAWVRKQGLTDVITFDRRHLSRLHGIQVSVPGSGVRHDKPDTHNGA